MTTKALPSWMEITEEGVSIKLTKPSELNQVKVDRLHLRSPTVRELRAATAQSGGDAEKREVILLASLAEVGQGDLEGLAVVNYNRVQAGYFRLVEDDEPYKYND
ncbi:hypothetical protein PS862_02872 [Pseudomonas fluorescens]|uniref:Phage tail assembly protein n=1 Tax=Pseudomonas fluorescens TaxID=294 RepID=A0A5E7KKS2_PSEFL|nr:phage tail assembly protein [Pseudomonas fluorescens]VVP01516.1 hypothetical protein PS862_02872 [Pseudomonas fluorescens]